MQEHQESGLECVDPVVGERILDLSAPALDSAERTLLEAHADVCAACRLTLDLHQELRSRARSESGTTGGRRPGSRPGATGWAAVAALAAGLALAAILPPRPVGPRIDGRGDDTPQVLRPVEGEVVSAGDVAVRWTPVPGADRYRVRATDPEGATTWTGTTVATDIRLPAEASSHETRILVTAEPQDIIPPGVMSVSYRTGGAWDVLRHRLLHSGALPQALGLGGVLLGLAAILRRRD